MAGATVSDQQARCKGCASYDRVSLTLEFCSEHKKPVLGQDAACNDHCSTTPWHDWLLTPLTTRRRTTGRENRP